MTKRRESSRRSAADFVPSSYNYRTLREAAANCQGCDLFEHATQTVFGEGPASARLMLVGEMPGNQEDRAAHPFVGAAGQLLNESLREARINRHHVYVTNAVKHFKWTAQGNRRLHVKPSVREIKACSAWLDAEITLVHPDLIVCLGATAAQALLGSQFRVTKQHGKILPSRVKAPALATLHPAAILRAPDSEARYAMRLEFVADLCVAAAWIKQRRSSPGDGY